MFCAIKYLPVGMLLLRLIALHALYLTKTGHWHLVRSPVAFKRHTPTPGCPQEEGGWVCFHVR